MYRFSARSYTNLTGVRPELVAVATLALSLTDVDFVVTEGVRTVLQQRKLVAAGASQMMRSPHLNGRAIDVAAWVGGEIRGDWPLYAAIAQAFKQAAEKLGVQLIWGGDLETSRRGPHFQLKPGD